jgi:hypothetical protein
MNTNTFSARKEGSPFVLIGHVIAVRGIEVDVIITNKDEDFPENNIRISRRSPHLGLNFVPYSNEPIRINSKLVLAGELEKGMRIRIQCFSYETPKVVGWCLEEEWEHAEGILAQIREENEFVYALTANDKDDYLDNTFGNPTELVHRTLSGSLPEGRWVKIVDGISEYTDQPKVIEHARQMLDNMKDYSGEILIRENPKGPYKKDDPQFFIPFYKCDPMLSDHDWSPGRGLVDRL